MNIVNTENMQRGKSKFCISKKTDFAYKEIDNNFISITKGESSFEYNSLVIAMTEVDTSLKTFSFDVRDAVALEFTVNGIKEEFAPSLSEIGIVLGDNKLKIISKEGNTSLFFNNTDLGVISKYHDISSNHGRLRNYTLRIDTNINRISLMASGQTFGYIDYENLSSLLSVNNAYFYFREKLNNTADFGKKIRIGEFEVKLYC